MTFAPAPYSAARPDPRLLAASLLDAPIESPWVNDPTGWVPARLNEFIWSKQREILDSVRDNRRTAVKSCHGVGKSFIAARAAAWWLDSHPAGEAFVVTTAPSFPQVRAILWKEINRAHRKGKLAGSVNQTEWWIDGEIVAFGRKPSDYDPAAFQGIHARYVLVVIDEACGVPKALFDAADTLVANEESRILAIGNPDDPSSEFAALCGPGTGWNVIRIRAADSPNLTGEEVPELLSHVLVSKLWVEEKKTSWGEGSPLYIAKVEGDFPVDAEDTVIPLGIIRAAQRDEGAPTAQEDDDIELGLDVGGGGNSSVIWARQGPRFFGKSTNHDSDSEKVVDWALRAIRETGAKRIKVDTIGIGWGVAGSLRRRLAGLGIACQVVDVNVGSGSSNPDRFPKLRDEFWWTFRELVQDRAVDLRGLDDDTVAQLCAPKLIPDPSGRTKLEPKDDTKARIGRSPDDADALLLCRLEPRGGSAGYSSFYRSEMERLAAARKKATEGKAA